MEADKKEHHPPHIIEKSVERIIQLGLKGDGGFIRVQKNKKFTRVQAFSTAHLPAGPVYSVEYSNGIKYDKDYKYYVDKLITIAKMDVK
jgi:hypothetical protein